MRLFEIESRNPKWTIIESKQDKSLNIENLEDLIFHEGFNGAKRAFNAIETYRKMFAHGQGKIEKVKVKWDGSTRIVCGTDPEDGKFFVGSEQVFQDKQAVCKTPKDIEKLFPDEKTSKKFKIALKHLSLLKIGNVLAGNFLFTTDDIIISNIDGAQMYTFTPNNTTYAVAVDSDLGNKISQAAIGITFNTTYEGNSLSNMQPITDVNVSGLQPNKSVLFDDDTYKDYTGIASLTPEENAKFLIGLRQSASTLTKIDSTKFNSIINNTIFVEYMRLFVHDRMSDKQMLIDPIRLMRDFIEFYKQKQLDKADKTDTEQKEKKDKLEEFIADNVNAILGIFSIYKKIIELKLLVLDKMQQVESLGIFVRDNNGYKLAMPNQFVAIGHDSGIVKFINAIEYKER